MSEKSEQQVKGTASVITTGQAEAPARQKETYLDAGIEAKPMRPHILAAATIIFGDDYYNGPRETVSLSGMVEINKWPMDGFTHKVREDGAAEFSLELLSREDIGIKGFSYTLNDRVQVLSHPAYPNDGTISQVVAGKNFPAEFKIRRFGVIQTSNMRLVHRNVINIHGIVDSIPPYRTPLSPPLLGVPPLSGGVELMKQPNVVGGVNLPEAWSPADEQLEPTAAVGAFFAAAPSGCVSMLVNPNNILQASAAGEIKLQLNGGGAETVSVAGDHNLAAGVEMLVYNADRHARNNAVATQLTRLALVGESATAGRLMLRATFFKVSAGQVGNGNEKKYEQVKFPAPISVEANLELCTPQGELVASAPVQLTGTVTQEDFKGTTLVSAGTEPVNFETPDGRILARLHNVAFEIGDGIWGTEATVAQ